MCGYLKKSFFFNLHFEQICIFLFGTYYTVHTVCAGIFLITLHVYYVKSPLHDYHLSLGKIRHAHSCVD